MYVHAQGTGRRKDFEMSAPLLPYHDLWACYSNTLAVIGMEILWLGSYQYLERSIVRERKANSYGDVGKGGMGTLKPR